MTFNIGSMYNNNENKNEMKIHIYYCVKLDQSTKKIFKLLFLLISLIYIIMLLNIIYLKCKLFWISITGYCI